MGMTLGGSVVGLVMAIEALRRLTAPRSDLELLHRFSRLSFFSCNLVFRVLLVNLELLYDHILSAVLLFARILHLFLCVGHDAKSNDDQTLFLMAMSLLVVSGNVVILDTESGLQVVDF
ncbi:uncharacterized protein LOC126410328 [Nymphaea colorata]|nr:uncharacterized protein LOC126410328 [Nymphaea colorata]